MPTEVEALKTQLSLARTELKNLRVQITALKYEHQKEILKIQATLSNFRCQSCIRSESPQTPTAFPLDSHITYKPIGMIKTSFHNKRAVPRQPTVLASSQGVVVIDTNVFSNPEHALDGLEEFSHMWIIFHFHNNEGNGTAKVGPPRLRGGRTGVFSTRAPHRPCPIGLSLVQIVNIEGNKINFLGVDMINDTPVLDVKPYIPQYDYPSPPGSRADIAGLLRPPTEGISHALQQTTLNTDQRLTNPIGIDTDSPLTPYSDVPSPRDDLLTPISPSPDSPSSSELLGTSRSPLRRPQTERGAPDGQERFTPPQSSFAPLNHDGIRVAQWVANNPSHPIQVSFSDDVNSRLTELIPDRADAFKSNLVSLLSEDPRSHYVRTRYPDHEYSCVLEDLSISCIFNDTNHTCTVIAVRNAEELQQN